MSMYVVSDEALQHQINWISFFLSLLGRWKDGCFGSNLLKFTTQSSSLLSAVVAFRCQMSWLQLYIMHTAVWVLMCFWEVFIHFHWRIIFFFFRRVVCFLDIKSPLNIHDSQKVRDIRLLDEIYGKCEKFMLQWYIMKVGHLGKHATISSS